MRFIITIIMLCIASLCHLVAKEIATLYPVYSAKYDRINDYILEKIKVGEQLSPYAKGVPPPMKTYYHFNLNNLLLLQNDEDSASNYFLLGKIIIDEQHKLTYVYYEVDDYDTVWNRELINKKRLEIQKSIAYINQGNFSLEEIKTLLDVDLIEESLGAKLYKEKKATLSVKEATNNLINCRLCEQMIEIYSTIYGCYQYTKYDNMATEFVLLNEKYIDRGSVLDDQKLADLYKRINSQGNIYKQLDPKYIAKSYDEWKKIVDKEKLNK